MRPVFDAIRRLLHRRPRGGDADFHDVAERILSIPGAEIAVAEAALGGGGVLCERLIRQLREAGHVWRHIADNGAYELRISTKDTLRIRDVPHGGWTSKWIPVSTDEGRPLELRVHVFEGGIVELVGQTADGDPWPSKWRPRAEDVERIRAAAPWLALPSLSELRAARLAAAETIGRWLGDEEPVRGRRGVLRVGPPAGEEDLAAFAARERFALPSDYRSLLLAADGIEIGPLVVLGTRDAYRLDMPGPARLVIAPPDEDGALTLDESGAVIHVGIGDETTDGTVVAPDLRRWLTFKLRRRKRSRCA